MVKQSKKRQIKVRHTINKLTGRQSRIKKEILPNGERSKIVDEANEYFVNVAADLTSSLPEMSLSSREMLDPFMFFVWLSQRYVALYEKWDQI